MTDRLGTLDSKPGCNPATSAKSLWKSLSQATRDLIRRWDLEWDKCDAAETGFWVDIADIKYHLKKAGVSENF